MSNYFKNLNKIEFVVTDACTGKCKHCSQGDHKIAGKRIDPKVARKAIIDLCKNYNIKTVMVFGGEPLIYPEAVYEILYTAKELNIPHRQLITNGFFKSDISEVAENLYVCGANDILLSVDAFHQETIPLERVKNFAVKLKNKGLNVRTQPAWLESKEDDNPYNNKTKSLLKEFELLEIYSGAGNVIFPEGNAKKYLSEYFKTEVINPYIEDEKDVRALSVSPDGSLLSGNIYKNNILDIMANYNP